MQPNMTYQMINTNTTAVAGNTAPEGGDPFVYQEIYALSGGALADELLRSIMELNIEQQTAVLAKIRELKAKILL